MPRQFEPEASSREIIAHFRPRHSVRPASRAHDRPPLMAAASFCRASFNFLKPCCWPPSRPAVKMVFHYRHRVSGPHNVCWSISARKCWAPRCPHFRREMRRARRAHQASFYHLPAAADDNYARQPFRAARPPAFMASPATTNSHLINCFSIHASG